eukprot:TRINITY_DN5941_c0_g1_i4.p1 TRINITY_DN5941_c0_g1~~TRINITY_DN5941_c0_g1_i4.p1  ORF type:complete len:133 (-),score=25.09 TRINITY_DN5941_c0_g1_i4:114-512(-)
MAGVQMINGGLLAGDQKGRLIVWDLSSGVPLQEISVHRGPVLDLALRESVSGTAGHLEVISFGKDESNFRKTTFTPKEILTKVFATDIQAPSHRFEITTGFLQPFQRDEAELISCICNGKGDVGRLVVSSWE